MVCPPDRARTREPRRADQRTHRGPLAGPPGHQPPPSPRPRRIRQPAPVTTDRGPLPRPHGPPGRQEGRTHPDGGGWRAHGRDSEQARTAQRAKTAGAKGGYVYLHSAVDGFSRLSYTEPLPDEKAATTVAFFTRARAFFAAHGIHRIVRVVTDNGTNYRAGVFGRSVASVASRHQRTKPYTPRHNGKVERYQRILAEELLYARPWTSEAERTRAIAFWNIHYNYHRPHTTAGNRPPASRLPASVTNVVASNN